MLVVTCLDKFRDERGRIYGYRVQTEDGEMKDVYASQLKAAISLGKCRVLNLKLTEDGRLIDNNNSQVKKDIFRGSILHLMIPFGTNDKSGHDKLKAKIKERADGIYTVSVSVRNPEGGKGLTLVANADLRSGPDRKLLCELYSGDKVYIREGVQMEEDSVTEFRHACNKLVGQVRAKMMAALKEIA